MRPVCFYFSASWNFASGICVKIQGYWGIMPSRVLKRYRHFGWRHCLHFCFLLCRPWRWRQHALPKLQYLCINATSYLRISISTAVSASNSLRINMSLWKATTKFIRDNCQLWILYKVPVILYTDCVWINCYFWREVQNPLCRTAAQIILSIDFGALWHQRYCAFLKRCQNHTDTSRTELTPANNGTLPVPSTNRQTHIYGITQTQFVSCEMWDSQQQFY